MPDTSTHIGLFGGTFDPVHFGHLTVAEDVKKTFDLEAVYFIPAAQPPHKLSLPKATAKDRMEMLKRAVSDYSGFIVSDVELRRTGPSFTVDTIRHFKEGFSRKRELLFILGLDAFLEVDTWKSYKTLFQLSPFVVIPRPGIGLSAGGIDPKDIEGFIRENISDGYRLSLNNQCFTHDAFQPIYVCGTRLVDISSTTIRERIRQALPVDDMVPKSVEAYIHQQGLYQ